MGKSGSVRSTAAAAAASLILAAASPPTSHRADIHERAALDLVRAQLKDPHSAQFKGVRTMGDKGGYCGWVNAKNSFGGYSGFSVFFVSSEGKVSILPPELSEESLCE
jgi:hypothetical protein